MFAESYYLGSLGHLPVPEIEIENKGHINVISGVTDKHQVMRKDMKRLRAGRRSGELELVYFVNNVSKWYEIFTVQ